MIVFAYEQHGITVIRTFAKNREIGDYRTGSRKPEGIGRLQYVLEWFWDQDRVGREVYRALDNSEKRQIIGMMDALNGLPVRPITEMKQRWEMIIGPIATMECANCHHVSDILGPCDKCGSAG